MNPFLTERQKAILEFIAEFQTENGLAPTHREICERFGYRSYGTVHKHLKLLQEKGYLERHWNQKRGVVLTTQGAEAVGQPAARTPFLGVIAAGKPIEALSGDDRLDVPDHLLEGPQGAHYVLKVVGDSMIGEGIHDGDLVVVLRREEARTGEMIVALVDDEATLKRYYPEGSSIRLQPSSPTMEAIYAPAERVKVQGIVVGLMRRY